MAAPADLSMICRPRAIHCSTRPSGCACRPARSMSTATLICCHGQRHLGRCRRLRPRHMASTLCVDIIGATIPVGSSTPSAQTGLSPTPVSSCMSRRSRCLPVLGISGPRATKRRQFGRSEPLKLWTPIWPTEPATVTSKIFRATCRAARTRTCICWRPCWRSIGRPVAEICWPARTVLSGCFAASCLTAIAVPWVNFSMRLGTLLTGRWARLSNLAITMNGVGCSITMAR